MIDKSKYLKNEDDGLMMRSSHEYARYKLKAVETYLKVALTAVKNTEWRAINYIDLQAGPGKNRIVEGGDILLGSPLIALTLDINPRINGYYFNERGDAEHHALTERVSASPYNYFVRGIYKQDVNEAVYPICDAIDQKDGDSQYAGYPPCFNIAFLDPEGLELEWSTIERLAQVKIMDLIINFSTGGLLRAIAKGYFDSVNRFFGTEAWQPVYDAETNATAKRRALIDFYRGRLKQFGYVVNEDPDAIGGTDIPFRNSRNSQVYSLIFAGKHELADKLWKVTKRSVDPNKRLPGFE